ncbi:glycoside hydrolase family 97 C-terminal domain-containing protein [Lewinella cohaerens]|uniref:glycoside hydrolase family 97 C-terminal domain-containing protein n=1 Tax=Lewinella cohaerens TaxID=70995 RepID=UPI000361CD10|nr:glycoside hydrolase family 97 C-terminal domain-containing protein [Lewinella cohaerens]
MDDGLFEMKMFKDGVNADRFVEDYKREVLEVNKNTRVAAEMAADGGWIAILSKK